MSAVPVEMLRERTQKWRKLADLHTEELRAGGRAGTERRQGHLQGEAWCLRELANEIAELIAEVVS